MAKAGSVLTSIANQVFGFNDADTLSTWGLQREYMWDVRLPELGKTVNIFGISIGGSTLADPGRFCQDIDFSDYNMSSTNNMQVGAYTNKFAGMLEIGEITMSFLKPNPDIVIPYFQKWFSLITKGGLYYPKKNYGKTIYIYMLGVDNMISGTFKCVGCFPKTMPSYKLSYGGEKVLTFPVRFSVDRIESF